MKKRITTVAKTAAIQTGKAVIKTAIAMIGTSVILSEVNWLIVLSASVLAGILSFLKSIEKSLDTNEENNKGKATKQKTVNKKEKNKSFVLKLSFDTKNSSKKTNNTKINISGKKLTDILKLNE